MCKMCYIGTNLEIAEKKFDVKNPSFCVELMDKSRFDSETFTTKNVYFIGSREGCGCSFGTYLIPNNVIIETKQILSKNETIPDRLRGYFQYEDTLEKIEETIAENKENSEDTQQLFSLINELINKDRMIEFFGCWAGDEMIKPDSISNFNSRSGELIIDFNEIYFSNIMIRFEKKRTIAQQLLITHGCMRSLRKMSIRLNIKKST